MNPLRRQPLSAQISGDDCAPQPYVRRMKSWFVVATALGLCSVAACDSARVVTPPRGSGVRRDAATDAVDAGKNAAEDGGASGADHPDVGAQDAELASTDAEASADAGEPVAPDAGVDPGFPRPSGMVALSFTVDDTANRVYTLADGLAWRGSFRYDAATRVMTYSAGWAGPPALLYDDGPWTAGGHEPVGARPGDHRWGVTVYLEPGAAPITIEYGAIRGSVAGSDGTWIWEGANGQVTVPADATADLLAPGLTLRPFGTIDLRLTLDQNRLASGTTPATDVRVKSSAWSWTEQVMVDDGSRGDLTARDGRFTFVLSEFVGAGRPLGPLVGLLRSGDTVQFVFVLDGLEYKVGGVPSPQGVTAELQPSGGAFTEVPVSNMPGGDRNTFVDVR